MKNANVINMDVDARVDKAINESMDIYLNKLKTGFIGIGLENTFQMHLANIIGRELEQRTFYKDERFIVDFEKNMPINGNKDYVDIVIGYQKGNVQKLYLIELKFKKKTDSAPDLGTVESYIDIYNLDCHHANTPNVCGCYFIFMTDLQTYIKSSTKGTRMQLPMHDGAEIIANKNYVVSGNAAKKASLKYQSGFVFSNNYNELCKSMHFNKILVLTFKPAVESAWQEDISRHVDFAGWQFVSNKEAKFDAKKLDQQYAVCDKTKPIVVFGSFQDLLGTNEAGGIKAKNEFIHTTNWDIIVFDEYHFGAWRENAKNLFEKYDEENDDFDLEKYQKEEAGNAINETFLPITAGHYLYLSGTPFRALNSGEFLEDQVFNWTYSDEQYRKEHWDYSLGANPYAALPQMVMLTYKVPDSITANIAINEGYDEFDINEFFRAEITEKGKIESARFVYENDVQKWLKMIQGNYMPVDGLKLGAERPPMPFSDTTLLNVLSHTLWFLPSVASCYAMSNLLQQKQNNFFADYKIIVCAGTKAGIGLDALKPVLNAMGDPLETKTITLSCGKLTTGVTVRPWAGVFMLRNLKSPETYFQTAFRAQSPWEVVNDNGDKEVVKKECYIFDFALERALHQISDYSCRLKIDDTSPEQKVKDFISFLPVLAFDGSSMNRIDAQDILDITYAGTSATLLAKRWQTALLVHVDNDTLKKLQKNQEALDALMRIEGFRSLNAEIQTIINRSERVKKLKKEKGDELTPDEKKELTDEEKKAKSLRKQVQENLLKLAARIPAFMYLTDYREQTIKDVITQIEPELFQKVTGLTVKDFDALCSIGLFDSEKMNQGIFGFRKYENSSLSYAGIDKHESEAIGGWDTVLRREEYEALYNKQQATMSDFESLLVPEKYRATNEVEPSTTAKAEIAATNAVITEKENSAQKELEQMLAKVEVGTSVTHKNFGNGTIVWMDNAKKYIRIKFAVGEKQFIFPDAFTSKFLEIT